MTVSKSAVSRIRKRCCEGGLDYALHEKPRCGALIKIDGKIEAQLTMLACSEPPDGRSKWTLKLLADRLVEMEVVDSIAQMAEIELSALSKQCLDRRIADLKILKHEASAWENKRNSIGATVRWQFKKDNARDRLQRHY